MEIRWLGEVELTFNPSFLPFPCPYIHGKKTPSHFPQEDLLQPQIYPVYPFDMPDLQPASSGNIGI